MKVGKLNFMPQPPVLRKRILTAMKNLTGLTAKFEGQPLMTPAVIEKFDIMLESVDKWRLSGTVLTAMPIVQATLHALCASCHK